MRTLSSPSLKSMNWFGVILFFLMFWFSASLLMDFVIMPGLFVTGMMSQPDFSTAGYSLFWVFNRLELVCVALVLTGLLVTHQARTDHTVMDSGIRSRWAIELALGLLAIVLAFTYALTPAMGALGVSLNAFEPATLPSGMNQLHLLYFGLEGLKLLGCGLLLKLYFHDLQVSGEA
ncbi:hypothetical protein GFS31_14760 [Leptolyngbya sp. BL0902]|uniref:DUF4149 domain-containing protein n=1 Tax=Leptolyngbya sp. BL0902 TaxID=1115757 RepID=UPI0018E87C9C|nr:hypothetical protein [Leptolyngbya sp. BL0902]QQE64794.1 hypothetical protein GFS31_14760 [Leptolyngbya sp. BL0902]